MHFFKKSAILILSGRSSFYPIHRFQYFFFLEKNSSGMQDLFTPLVTTLLLLLSLLIYSSSAANSGQEFHLNGNGIGISEVSILLPYKSSGKLLKATGDDCFLWTSNNPDLIRIEYISTNVTNHPSPCSKEVKIIPLGDSLHRKSAIIYAKSAKKSF